MTSASRISASGQNLGVTSTGVDSTGAPITFNYETPPYATATVTFLQAYVRSMPANQFAVAKPSIVSAERGPGPYGKDGVWGGGNGNGYTAGSTAELGVNECAALVARGIAEYS